MAGTLRAATIMLPVFFLGDWQWVLEPRGAAVALYLGLATNAVPYLLFGLGLTLIPVATAATLTLMEPLTATLLGVAWLDERLSTLQWFGVALLHLPQEVVMRYARVADERRGDARDGVRRLVRGVH